MCAALDLFASNGKQRIVILREQRLFRLATSLSIDAFADQQWWRVLLHGGSTNTARDERWYNLSPLFLAQVIVSKRTRTAWSITTGFDDRSQVFVATAATATDNIDSELSNEVTQRRRHRFRLQWIDRLAVD